MMIKLRHSKSKVKIQKLDTIYFKEVSKKLYLLLLFIHFSFIFLFYAQGVTELAIFNAASVFLYIFVLTLNAKNFLNIAFCLVSLEIFFHAYFCSIFIGDAGFSDALLIVPVLFFLSNHTLPTKLGFLVSITFVYFLLVLNDQFSVPIYNFSEFKLGVFEVLTAMLTLTIDSYIAFKASQAFSKVIGTENEYN